MAVSVIAGWLVRLGIVGALVLAIAAVGNAYGPNARRVAKYEAETLRRNNAVERANRLETARHEQEDRDRAAQDDAFREAAKGLKPCILTDEQASALNLIGE